MAVVVVLIGTRIALFELGEYRFSKVRPGMTHIEIERRFGKPTRIKQAQVPKRAIVLANGCGDRDRECWWYESRIRGSRIVCFDEYRAVTCQTDALIWY